jgi:2-phospho-L-lactate guanylyltransferase
VRVAALVPFKCFTRAKQRLRARYDDAQVEALSRAMLADVLDALHGVDALEAVRVLTDDRAVRDAAARAGAQVRLVEPDPGLNPAIDQAAAEAAEQGFEAALVVLGDLPLLAPQDVQAVLEAGAASPVVIVPSEDGGTAMLLRRGPLCIPARFGEKSASRHAEAARDKGLEASLVTSLEKAVRVDLDTPEDAEQVISSGRDCRTRKLLRSYAR